MYREKIKQLCQEQTDLELDDIDWLVEKAESLLADSNYSDEDVFIDVQNIYSEHAIVIFHKKPTGRESLYEKTVVGSLAYLQNEPGVIRTLQTGAPSIGLSALSQEGLVIQQTVFPLVRENRVIGTLIVEKDGSTFALQDEGKDGASFTGNLSHFIVKQFAFLDYIDDAVLIFDKTGQLIYFNQKAEETYRQKLAYKDVLTGMHYDNLVLNKRDFAGILQENQDFQRNQTFEAEISYGPYAFWVKEQILAEKEVLMMTCRDITQMKQQEKSLLLGQTSLREINHRVKNNLQTVVSLLRLQAQRSQNEDLKKNLYDSVNRVLSISMTHEALSAREGDEIFLEGLLTGVVENVQNCFLGRLDISLTHQLDSTVSLDGERATALALIVNELLQNSHDHAFNGIIRKKPKIHLQIWTEDDIILVKVTDNGSGYDVKQVFSNHLGLMIVERFVKGKLLGKLAVHSDENGTETTITFKK